MPVLRDLFSLSDGFSILISEGRSISLCFKLPGISDHITVYQPTETEFVYDADSFDPSSIVGEVAGIFREFSIGEEKEAISEVLQWYKDKNHIGEITDISAYGRFLRMKPIVQRIVNAGFFSEVTYDDDISGCGVYSVDFSISAEDHIPRIITGKLQGFFAELLMLSEELMVECNPDLGIVNLYFFA